MKLQDCRYCANCDEVFGPDEGNGTACPSCASEISWVPLQTLLERAKADAWIDSLLNRDREETR